MLALLFSCADLHADLLDDIRARGVLKWGADQEGGGPFVYPSESDPDRLVGFEVELAELIAAEIGVRQSSVRVSGTSCRISSIAVTSTLCSTATNGHQPEPIDTAFRSPYYIYELQLLVRKSDSTLKSWNDLLVPIDGRKRRVSVLGGAAAQDYVEQFAGDQVELSLFDGVTDALRATELATDGIDANVQDLPIWTSTGTGSRSCMLSDRGRARLLCGHRTPGRSEPPADHQSSHH